jgi:small-conductance mechanosensitive channel
MTCRKNFLVSILIANFFFAGISQAQIPEIAADETQSQDSTADSLALNPDVEFLIAFSQVIKRDKDRLQKLLHDSVTLEPSFKENTVRFYYVDKILDSLQSNTTVPEQIASADFERRHLKEILDFLLERRRSLHLQIRVLNLKVKKEEEILRFFVKGETFAVLENALEKNMSETQSKDLTDSTFTKVDSLQGDRFDPNEFNWSVIKAERELAVLRARFDFVKNKWIFLEDLLGLNEDDLSLVTSLSKSEDVQLQVLKENLRALNQKHEYLDDSLIQEMQEHTASTMLLIENRVAEDSALISDLEARIQRLKGFQQPISDSARRVARDIEKQSRWVQFLKSPLAPHRILSFVTTNGPRILALLAILFLSWVLIRWLIAFMLPRLRLRHYKSFDERQQRIETLSRAFRSSLTVIILVVGVLTVLSEFGINVSVLLGGAAVFSLAIAFGAQSLVKDYFSGFMILTENQYRVGDVVQINTVSGVVEDISLRMTILRDLEGVAHFIPHSEIRIVSNLTHGWARVALDLKVAYKENVDTVMEVVMEVARALRKDEMFGRLILDEPEMLGVDAFAESGVIVKVLIKTMPMKQWLVKREFLRRIKNRFDELNIEIAIPHSKVYYESEESIIPFDTSKTDKGT